MNMVSISPTATRHAALAAHLCISMILATDATSTAMAVVSHASDRRAHD